MEDVMDCIDLVTAIAAGLVAIAALLFPLPRPEDK